MKSGPMKALIVAALMLAAPAAQADFSFGLRVTPNSAEARDALQLGLGLYALHRALRGGEVDQRGTNNRAELRQSGPGHLGVIRQRGNGHSAQLTQQGTGNSQVIIQTGRGTTANVFQGGKGETGLLFLHGF